MECTKTIEIPHVLLTFWNHEITKPVFLRRELCHTDGMYQNYWNSLGVIDVLKSWKNETVIFIRRELRHTDGMHQNYWNSSGVIHILKSWNRETDTCTRRELRHTDAMQQN